jgi:hypothetical protein
MEKEEQTSQNLERIRILMSTPVKEVQKRYQLELTRYQKQIARVRKLLLIRKNKAA